MIPEIQRLRGDLVRLSAEAAEFPALREGRQTLYDLNTRLARQLADLQHRSTGAPDAPTHALLTAEADCMHTTLLQEPAIWALSWTRAPRSACQQLPARWSLSAVLLHPLSAQVNGI